MNKFFIWLLFIKQWIYSIRLIYIWIVYIIHPTWLLPFQGKSEYWKKYMAKTGKLFRLIAEKLFNWLCHHNEITLRTLFLNKCQEMWVHNGLKPNIAKKFYRKREMFKMIALFYSIFHIFWIFRFNQLKKKFGHSDKKNAFKIFFLFFWLKSGFDKLWWIKKKILFYPFFLGGSPSYCCNQNANKWMMIVLFCLLRWFVVLFRIWKPEWA